MSRDIRSFFPIISKKPNQPNLQLQKKRVLALDSSDEDVVEVTPNKQAKKDKHIPKRKKVLALSSDSEDDFSKTSQSKATKMIVEPKKEKKVNAADIFGSAPVKQSKVEPQKPKIEENQNRSGKGKATTKTLPEEGIHNDVDFEKSLLELDEDLLLENADVLDKTIEEALHQDSKQDHKSEVNKKRKKSDEEHTEYDHDQDVYEKKRYSAMLYQRYLNRSGPSHHGEKEYPKGKPDCLKNLCFLRTGVLDSLESEEFQTLVKEHGGRAVKAVSKKVNYIVVGEDAGPAKLAKASDYNIPTINENEFLDLILTKSGMKPKFAVKDSASPENQDDNSEVKITHSESKRQKLSDAKSPVKTDKTQKNQHDVNKDHPDKKETKINSLVEKKSSVETIKIDSEQKIKKEVTIPLMPIKRKSADSIILPASVNTMAWTDKYKPENIKAIIGQQGEKSNLNKLMVWLQNWHRYHTGKTKTKLIKPSPWAKNDDGSFYKCALLSGPPGVGKTTTATLVAKELGFDVVEFNASDTRSKKLLHSEVAQLLTTTSLAGFFKEGSAPTRRHVLLMDEVDGMAGNEDRGGMQELINLIKKSNIPIICMCNDRNHQKVRSLANYCFDLRFVRPRLEQIKGAMMSICFKENLTITPDALSEIITGAGMDIRQILNHLSLWTANNKTLTADVAGTEAKAAKKDTIIGPWDVVRKVFSEEEHKNMSLLDKSKLFFYDYSIGPLFVQENYLQVVPHCPKNEVMQRIANAADAISTGDLVDRKIRSGNNWSLLDSQAMFSSVLPGHYMEGHMGGQINFPGWLGKNSKRGKFQRLLTDLQAHMRTSISASRTAVNLDYIYRLRDSIITPLKKEGMAGVQKSVEVMNSYNLLREDLDSLSELSHWPKQPDVMAAIESKIKAAFTRTYNKEVVKLPYAAPTAISKKKTTVNEDNLYGEDEGELSAEDDNDISKDNMIIAKKPPKQASKKNVTTDKKAGKGTGKKTK